MASWARARAAHLELADRPWISRGSISRGGSEHHHEHTLGSVDFANHYLLAHQMDGGGSGVRGSTVGASRHTHHGFIPRRLKSRGSSKVSSCTKRSFNLKQPQDDEDHDYLLLSILAGVHLEISTSWPDEASYTYAGSYTITGPAAQLTRLEELAGNDQSLLRGHVSPKCRVTLPLEHRKSAGIPPSAYSFCYIYPLDQLQTQLRELKLSHCDWAFVLMLGGFAYFDGEGELMSINAITMAQSETGLALVGYSGSDGAIREMQQAGRLLPTLPALTAMGFEAYGWVHPSEELNGERASEHTAYEHGGFLYQKTEELRKSDVADAEEVEGLTGGSCDDGAAHRQMEDPLEACEIRKPSACFYAISPLNSKEYKSVLSKVKRTRARWEDGDWSLSGR